MGNSSETTACDIAHRQEKAYRAIREMHRGASHTGITRGESAELRSTLPMRQCSMPIMTQQYYNTYTH